MKMENKREQDGTCLPEGRGLGDVGEGRGGKEI